MLVHERTPVFGKLQYVAGIAHGQRERGGFGGGQPAEINGHEQRGHLVIGNFPNGELADQALNFRAGEGLALALGFDEGEKVHFTPNCVCD